MFWTKRREGRYRVARVYEPKQAMGPPNGVHFESDSPIVRRDSGRQLLSLPALAETSPKARLKAYFSRACPQDDVSSTRQTPSNYGGQAKRSRGLQAIEKNTPKHGN